MTGAKRRLLAEFLGNGLLVTVVVGSGIAAQTLSTDLGVELLENALATAVGLAILILMAQAAGAIGGTILANAMFAKPLVSWSQHHRSQPHLLLGEVVATAGLLVVIVALARNGKGVQTPWAVGAYIGAAYFFTSSTSFANPAVSIGRAFTNTFAGIAPASLPGFIAAQLVGGGVGLGLLALLYPAVDQVANDLVIPHDNAALTPAMETTA